MNIPPPAEPLIPASLAVAALTTALGWAARGPALEDLDGANFRLGLDHFALALHQPHFPGYPVFMALAGALYTAGLGGVAALQLPGAVGWGAGVGAFAYAAGRRYGAWVGGLAAGFAAASPLALLTSGRTGSDALGAGLLLVACSAFSEADRTGDRRFSALSAALAGLVLGVRLSYAPAVFGLLALLAWRPDRAVVAAAVTGGLLAWALPFAAFVGPGALLAEAPTFVAGHFFHWGGTALVAHGPSLLARAAAWAASFVGQGLGLPTAEGSLLRWLWLPFAVLGALVGVGQLPARERGALAAVALPYGAWLGFGQNPEHPRHLLPLVPLAALLIGRGLALQPVLGVVAVGVAVGVVVPLAITHATVPSPESQLARWMVDHERPDRVLLFAGQSERVLLATAPAFRVEYAPDAAEMGRRLLHLNSPPPRLLWTDEFPGSASAPPGFGPPQVVAVFARDAAVDPHRPRITLYTATPETP